MTFHSHAVLHVIGSRVVELVLPVWFSSQGKTNKTTREQTGKGKWGLWAIPYFRFQSCRIMEQSELEGSLKISSPIPALMSRTWTTWDCSEPCPMWPMVFLYKEGEENLFKERRASFQLSDPGMLHPARVEQNKIWSIFGYCASPDPWCYLEASLVFVAFFSCFALPDIPSLTLPQCALLKRSSCFSRVLVVLARNFLESDVRNGMKLSQKEKQIQSRELVNGTWKRCMSCQISWAFSDCWTAATRV